MNPEKCREKVFAEFNSVIIAVSGGADSTALLISMHACLEAERLKNKEKTEKKLFAAHLNHCLRGDESDGDEEFTRRLCEKLGVPLFCEKADIAVVAKEKKISIELAARQARYEFLERARKESGAEVIATAHTADDNAETVIMNLVRGTGLRGLSGIPERRGNIIRPLLSCEKFEILEYLENKGQNYRTDSSNSLPDYRRNRIRNFVIPALKEENSALIKTINRAAATISKENDFIETAAEALRKKCEISKGVFDAAALKEAEPVLAKRVLLGAGCEDFQKTEEIYALVQDGKTSDKIQLTGDVFARISYGNLVIGEISKADEKNDFRLCKTDRKYILHVNTLLKNSNLLCDIILDKDKICGELFVRERAQGDKIGSKTLQKIFINKKIPQEIRGKIPVICDERGIVACAVTGADKKYKPDKETKNIIIIEIGEE